MTRAENFFKKAKCTHGHRSVMSSSAWCDLKKTVLLWNHIKYVRILTVIVRNKLRSLQNTTCLKADRLKVECKKFSEEYKLLGINLSSPV